MVDSKGRLRETQNRVGNLLDSLETSSSYSFFLLVLYVSVDEFPLFPLLDLCESTRIRYLYVSSGRNPHRSLSFDSVTLLSCDLVDSLPLYHWLLHYGGSRYGGGPTEKVLVSGNLSLIKVFFTISS